MKNRIKVTAFIIFSLILPLALPVNFGGAKAKAEEKTFIDEDTYMGCTMDSPLMTGDFSGDAGVKAYSEGINYASTYQGASTINTRSYNNVEENGIDVSHWNNDVVENGKTVSKEIDFMALKRAGYNFVIIKAAGRTTGGGTLYVDPCFEMNYKAAREAGMNIGVYFYAQAINKLEALEEAVFMAETIQGKALELPVFYDYEWSENHRLSNTEDDRTEVIDGWCGAMKSAGYITGVYASDWPLRAYIDGKSLSEKYWMWVANYSTFPRYYTGPVDIHQYTSTCPGIGVQSTYMDANVWYSPLASNEVAIYRLYDEGSGEHVFTADAEERTWLVEEHNWIYEKVAWVAPNSTTEGTADGKVYRLYNTNSGEHVYTANAWEAIYLQMLTPDDTGWILEKTAFFADETKTGVPIYRLYNENAEDERSSHHYTKNLEEKQYLVNLGWKDEGIKWYENR